MVRFGKLEGTLLISFLLVFSFSLLYIFRSFDTNTLVSWKWVFAEKKFTAILPFLLSGIALSFAISRYIMLEKFPVSLLVTLSLASVLPLWSEPEIMLDSGRYFLQAKYLSEYGALYFIREWGQTISSWTDLPLIPFLYGFILKFGNESRLVIQLFNTIIFCLTVIYTYKIGNNLWDKELGLYAGLLLIGMPYLLTQVPQMLVDVHTMFFHVVAVYYFLKAIRSKNNFSLFLSSAAILLAVFVKFSTWPMLALLPLIGFFTYQHDRHNIILIRAALILIIASLSSLVLICFKLDVFSSQMEIFIHYQKPALKLWGEGVISSLLFQWHPFVLILVIVSFFRAYPLRDKRFLIVSIYCLLIVLLQIQRIRYMIPLLPFIALVAAYGIVSFKEKQIRRFTGLLIISSSLTIVFGIYLPFLNSTSMMNIKRAGETLNQLEVQSVSVTVLPQERSEGSTFSAIPLLDLFTEKKIISPQRWPGTKPDHLSPYSPLLFTWKQNKPSYYTQNNSHSSPPEALVIISSTGPTTKEHDLLNISPYFENEMNFTQYSGSFRYRTLVSIYY